MFEKTVYRKKLYLLKRKRNIKILFFFIIFVFIVLLLFFGKIQIVKYDYYLKLSTRNIKKIEKLTPLRGLIKDRTGKIIADNRLSFDLIIPRENLMGKRKKNTFKQLKLFSNIHNKDSKRKRILRNFGTYYLYDEDLSFKDVNYFYSNQEEFKNISLKISPRRLYVLDESGSSFLGYVGEANQREIKKYNLSIGDFVGKTGIEKYYEELIKGKKGERIQVVNSRGILNNIIKSIPPKQGYTLNLTIDSLLQKKIEKLLIDNKKIGSVIVLKPKTGEILSLVSTPLFNPNIFTSYFSQKEWDNLINKEGKPLINKTIKGLYSPGSIFKLVVGLAGLEEGLINERSIVNCYGYKEIYNKIFHCWKSSGHGPMNLKSAIEQSCDVYFYLLGKSLKIDTIEHYAKMMGLGTKTGIDLVGEKRGLVPSREWKKKTYNLIWFPGETISVAIGQGPVLVTPLQIAQMFSIIANRGYYVTPHLLKYYNSGKKKIFPQYKIKKVPIKKENFEKIIKGMWFVVNGEKGTGKLAKVNGVDVCGKTSTVQVISKETLKLKVKNKKERRWSNHAWFGAFAPRKNPEIVVVVMIEHSGGGGDVAAPIAGKIIKMYFKGLK
jgi:penicillin-binding protein 2